MSNVRTVSDTKRAFYNHFTRPIASIYRRVIEELMVEMHLLSVSTDFVYDPIYALGIVTTYDRFMEGYRPEEDREQMFIILCQAIEASPEQYRGDAQQLLDSIEGLTIERFEEMVENLESMPDEGLAGILKGAASRDRFKYSRAFGIGLYTLLEKMDPEFVKGKEKLMALVKKTSEATGISFDKIQKDLELYSSNLDKMVQAKAVMADILAAERKKREERAQALAAKETSETESDGDSKESEASVTAAPEGGDDEKQ